MENRGETSGQTTGLADYHIHTERCGHATGTVEEYVEAAIGAGLSQIGFSDHLPMPGRRDPSLTMTSEELPLYVDDVLTLRSRYPGIEIKLGIEVDYAPGCEDLVSDTLASFPFDFVLGSVHFIDGWGFDDSRYLEEWRRRSVDDVFDAYFALLVRAIESDLFDIMAHPDLVKKFGFSPTQPQEDNYRMVSDALSRKGKAVELSSAGWRKPVKEAYPSESLLRHLVDAGVTFTLGSDAHRPGDVGRDFDRLLQLLKRCGGGAVAFFEDRKVTQTTMIGA